MSIAKGILDAAAAYERATGWKLKSIRIDPPAFALLIAELKEKAVVQKVTIRSDIYWQSVMVDGILVDAT